MGGLEGAWEKFEQVSGTDDIGQKRYLLFQAFEDILEELDRDSFMELEGFDGYLYKNAQEFLMSSSTYTKESKMEDMLEYVERKYRG